MTDRLNLRWTVDIERPAAEVFDYLADISRHGEWSPKPFRVEGLAPGPVSPRTTFVSYGPIPGDKEHRNDVDVTAVSPPVRLSFNSREQNGDVFINTLTVNPVETGCRVEREWDLV